MLRSWHMAFGAVAARPGVALGARPFVRPALGLCVRHAMTAAKAHRVLGVDTGASRELIKGAYRAKALEFHPDKHAIEGRAEAQKK